MERREVLRMMPHGLQIVTVVDGERHYGYTSSWMTQASFDPPLLAMGIRKGSTSRAMMDASGVFVVHFLGKEQLDLAREFFKSSGHSDDKLAGLEWEPGPKTGCPVLTGVLAHAECKVVHTWEGGDHDLVVGEVVDAMIHREGEPLTLADSPWQYGG